MAPPPLTRNLSRGPPKADDPLGFLKHRSGEARRPPRARLQDGVDLGRVGHEAPHLRADWPKARYQKIGERALEALTKTLAAELGQDLRLGKPRQGAVD